MRRALAVICAAALSSCAGGGPASRSAMPAVPDSANTNAQSIVPQSFAGTTWNVSTGSSSNAYALQDLDFYPGSITVNAGDSIAYHVASPGGGDAHTVSFVPPGQKVPPPFDPNDLVPAGGTTIDGTKFVNSGILLGGQIFTLHFTTPGTYKILCLFHEPAMVSTVVVQKAGTPYPHTAQFYITVAQNDRWEDLGAAQLSIAEFPFTPGGKTLAAGIDPGLVHFPPPDSTVLRFLDTRDTSKLATSGNVTIKVGSVLTWVNETSNEPHTITFPGAGKTELPNIPPDPAINTVAPPGITSFDGTHLVNSGTIIGGHKFMLKFTKPGSYFYACVYHDNARMSGTVTVTP